MLQHFKALATLPFEQDTEIEISHFILEDLPDGYLDFPTTMNTLHTFS